MPEIRANIERPEAITLTYQDLNQKNHEKKFTGLTSRVIQHELDHLNGVLFIDHLSVQERERVLNEYESGFETAESKADHN